MDQASVGKKFNLRSGVEEATETAVAAFAIVHTKTTVRHPQTNGICERFHQSIRQEFYPVTFRRTIYRSSEELQRDLNDWRHDYNYERPP
jgi:transposase InsO family protein